MIIPCAMLWKIAKHDNFMFIPEPVYWDCSLPQSTRLSAFSKLGYADSWFNLSRGIDSMKLNGKFNEDTLAEASVHVRARVRR